MVESETEASETYTAEDPASEAPASETSALQSGADKVVSSETADASVTDAQVTDAQVTDAQVTDAQVTDESANSANSDDKLPQQAEMPFAMVYGEAVTSIPKDLYIPPDALEVFLEAFEGPLDLLLYLIKRQNLDVLDIQVSEITKQYVEYVELMRAVNFELAAEYLVMAALLGEIKSRSLLPRPKHDEGEETDPRAELIRRLQEYERYKQAAEDIEALPRMGRDLFPGKAEAPAFQGEKPLADVDLREVLVALQEVLLRADMYESHHISRETLSTRERMSQVLDQIRHRPFVPFGALFTAEEGRLGVVVTFLAILELVKESLIELVQTQAFAPIHVRVRDDKVTEHDSVVLVEEELVSLNEDDDSYELTERGQEEKWITKELEELSTPEDFSILDERIEEKSAVSDGAHGSKVDNAETEAEGEGEGEGVEKAENGNVHVLKY